MMMTKLNLNECLMATWQQNGFEGPFSDTDDAECRPGVYVVLGESPDKARQMSRQTPLRNALSGGARSNARQLGHQTPLRSAQLGDAWAKARRRVGHQTPFRGAQLGDAWAKARRAGQQTPLRRALLGGAQDRVIYVGQAGNVRERLTGHPKWECWERNNATGFLVKYGGNKNARLNLEQRLIKHYQPSCNTQK